MPGGFTQMEIKHACHVVPPLGWLLWTICF